MTTRICHVTRITPTGLVPDSTLEIQGTKIKAVYDDVPPPAEKMQLIDGSGLYAAPGFVDIHLHGGGGVEFMAAEPEEICQGCLAHARRGTTTLLPTTLAAPMALTLKMMQSVRKAQAMAKGCTIAGVHLEGPFLSPTQSGAQSPDALAIPTPQIWNRLLDQWPGGIRLMGIAPELPNALALGDVLKARGIPASIAHSDADYDTCVSAASHGYRDITHIYSGCSTVRRRGGFRMGGVVEAGLLRDEFTVQVIADGCHLPAELLQLIVKCKGPEKISLITDALFAAGTDLPEGTVLRQANGVTAIVEDGVMKLPNRQAFAGSIATMDRLVRNMVKLAGVPLWDAVTMASATPARVIGMEHRKGRLLPGFDADLVLLDRQLQVQRVMAMGEWLSPLL